MGDRHAATVGTENFIAMLYPHDRGIFISPSFAEAEGYRGGLLQCMTFLSAVSEQWACVIHNVLGAVLQATM